MVDQPGLASYIEIRNVVDEEISRTIGRPAHAGHIAEYIAARVCDIKLMIAANQRSIDGHFQSGNLTGSSLNIKFGTCKHGMIKLVPNLNVKQHPHYYLVLTGPPIGTASSKGLSAPWIVRQVLLFKSDVLLASLAERRIKLGVATSIRTAL